MSKREREAQALRQQKINQLNQQAHQFVANSRQTHLAKPIKHLEWAQHTYVGYGYNAITGLGMMGACVALSSRFAFLGNMASILALGTGFLLGGYLHQFHVMAAKRLVVRGIDASLPEVEKMDAKYAPEGCKEYGAYSQYMINLKKQLQPDMQEMVKQAAMTIDDRVDDIIAAYEARKAGQAK